jgi:hypothetical protein
LSHHPDSPLARKGARLNITDHYVLDSGSSTVLIMNVRTSLAGDLDAGPVPPRSRYEFKIHLRSWSRHHDDSPRWSRSTPPLSPLTAMDCCQKQRRPLPSERLIYFTPPGRAGRRECLKLRLLVSLDL